MTSESTISESTVSIFYTSFRGSNSHFTYSIENGHLILGHGTQKCLSWVAIDVMSHTLPKMHVLLDRLSEAVDPATVEIIKSIIKETGATAPKLQGLLDELS